MNVEAPAQTVAPALEPAGDTRDGEGVEAAGPTLSPSRAADFMTCPLLYRFRTIDRLPEPPSPAATRGTIVHAVLEQLFDLPAGERTVQRAAALVAPVWEQLVEAEPDLAALFDDDQDGSALAEWIHGAEELVRCYFTLEDPPRLEPAERELYVETVLDSGLRLRGYVDRVDRASATGDLRVVDYKTGKAVPRVDAMADDLQLATYHLAASKDPLLNALGPPTQLHLLYLRRMEVREQEVRPDHAEVTEGRILSTAERILAEEFEPSAAADCDHCDFHRLCPLWPEGREVGES